MTDIPLPVRLARIAEILRRPGLLEEARGPMDIELLGVSQDSREVKDGDLFLAWRGTEHDGHAFVEEAERRGAAAAVVERFVEEASIPQLRVSEGRRAAALAAMEMMRVPGRRMFVTAVTGTNGKTTTAHLVRQVLAERVRSAAIGTLGVVDPEGRVREGTGGLTTPGPVAVARLLRDLEDDGVTAVTLEASSHALEQRRLDALQVDAALFTTFSQDHLDYHPSAEAYFAAKAHLLELLIPEGTVIVNGDDPAWAGLPGLRCALRVVGSADGARPGTPPGRERLPDLLADRISLSGAGSRFVLREDGAEAEVHLPLIGRFNVENALVAAGAARAWGFTLEETAAALGRVSAPPGRLEVAVSDPVPVVLDYAHTPDALARALEALRPLHEGRLIVVFGAGGDRDRGKRPGMGRAAELGADHAIVTSDNPRTEDPDRIIDEILTGMTGEGGATQERITDRREAIRRALDIARPGDVVLVAGKGHETVQIVGTERRPFDERALVRELAGGGPRA